MLHRFVVFAVLTLLLAGCEAGLFFGGLPSNEACRDARVCPAIPSARSASTPSATSGAAAGISPEQEQAHPQAALRGP